MTPPERAQRIDLLLLAASLLIAVASMENGKLQRELNQRGPEPPEPIPMPAAVS